MKLGLVGLPQVGKRTLFQLLTGQETGLENAKAQTLGLAKVRDDRFERLVNMYEPKKVTSAQMAFSLLPDLDTDPTGRTDAIKGLEQVDVVCYLARVFEDDTVFHIEGSVDARRDISGFCDELLLIDQMFVEKRLERLEKEKKQPKNSEKATRETELMLRLREFLESERPLRHFEFSADDEDLIASYAFLTRKPMVVILNVGEGQVGDTQFVLDMAEEFDNHGCEWIGVSARIEQEIEQLETEERDAFLADLELDQPALDRLTLLCYEALGLISYFTVGEDEVRAWTVQKGALAPQAGRVIHKDIERGFIRAEVMTYDDLVHLGSEQSVKLAGKLMQKGRDSVVDDGDVIHFLFKV